MEKSASSVPSATELFSSNLETKRAAIINLLKESKVNDANFTFCLANFPWQTVIDFMRELRTFAGVPSLPTCKIPNDIFLLSEDKFIEIASHEEGVYSLLADKIALRAYDENGIAEMLRRNNQADDSENVAKATQIKYLTVLLHEYVHAAIPSEVNMESLDTTDAPEEHRKSITGGGTRIHEYAGLTHIVTEVFPLDGQKRLRSRTTEFLAFGEGLTQCIAIRAFNESMRQNATQINQHWDENLIRTIMDTWYPNEVELVHTIVRAIAKKQGISEDAALAKLIATHIARANTREIPENANIELLIEAVGATLAEKIRGADTPDETRACIAQIKALVNGNGPET